MRTARLVCTCLETMQANIRRAPRLGLVTDLARSLLAYSLTTRTTVNGLIGYRYCPTAGYSVIAASGNVHAASLISL